MFYTTVKDKKSNKDNFFVNQQVNIYLIYFHRQKMCQVSFRKQLLLTNEESPEQCARHRQRCEPLLGIAQEEPLGSQTPRRLEGKFLADEVS